MRTSIKSVTNVRIYVFSQRTKGMYSTFCLWSDCTQRLQAGCRLVCLGVTATVIKHDPTLKMD